MKSDEISIEGLDTEALKLSCKPWLPEAYFTSLESVKVFLGEFLVEDVRQDELKQALEICLRAKLFREEE